MAIKLQLIGKRPMEISTQLVIFEHSKRIQKGLFHILDYAI